MRGCAPPSARGEAAFRAARHGALNRALQVDVAALQAALIPAIIVFCEPVLRGARRIAELLDHVDARDRMEIERLHVAVFDHEAAQLRIIGVLHMPGRGERDIAFAVVAGVKAENRVALDADVPDRQEQRAGGIASPDDAKRGAGLVIFRDHRIEAGELSAGLKTARSIGERRGRSQRQRKGSKSEAGRFHARKIGRARRLFKSRSCAVNGG